MDTSRGALTLLGCAWMERAVRTDSTLKRKGRRPPKASRTLGPRQAGCSASQEPNDRGGSRPSNTSASPLGWAPIHSWGTALRPAQPRRDGGPRGRRDRASASPRRRAARARRSPRGPRWPPAVPRRCAARAAPRRSSSPGSATGTLQDGGGGTRVTAAAAATRVRPPGAPQPGTHRAAPPCALPTRSPPGAACRAGHGTPRPRPRRSDVTQRRRTRRSRGVPRRRAGGPGSGGETAEGGSAERSGGARPAPPTCRASTPTRSPIRWT